jgi:inhibitor of cysteine peptidase
MELTREDAGGRRSVRVGERIEVRLPERPTTGYRWQPDVDPSVLRQVDDRFDGEAAPRGAGGVRTLAFEALRPGPARLRLASRRAWEGEAVDEFVVDLEITPSQGS